MSILSEAEQDLADDVLEELYEESRVLVNPNPSGAPIPKPFIARPFKKRKKGLLAYTCDGKNYHLKPAPLKERITEKEMLEMGYYVPKPPKLFDEIIYEYDANKAQANYERDRFVGYKRGNNWKARARHYFVFPEWCDLSEGMVEYYQSVISSRMGEIRTWADVRTIKDYNGNTIFEYNCIDGLRVQPLRQDIVYFMKGDYGFDLGIIKFAWEIKNIYDNISISSWIQERVNREYCGKKQINAPNFEFILYKLVQIMQPGSEKYICLISKAENLKKWDLWWRITLEIFKDGNYIPFDLVYERTPTKMILPRELIGTKLINNEPGITTELGFCRFICEKYGFSEVRKFTKIKKQLYIHVNKQIPYKYTLSSRDMTGRIYFGLENASNLFNLTIVRIREFKQKYSRDPYEIIPTEKPIQIKLPYVTGEVLDRYKEHVERITTWPIQTVKVGKRDSGEIEWGMPTDQMKFFTKVGSMGSIGSIEPDNYMDYPDWDRFRKPTCPTSPGYGMIPQDRMIEMEETECPSPRFHEWWDGWNYIPLENEN